MPDQPKQSRLNRKSFIANSIFFLPVLLIGIGLGNVATYQDSFTEGMVSVARIVSLILAIFYIRLVVARLHDAGHSSWFSLLLIPPTTLFFLIYLLIARSPADNKWGTSSSMLYMFGIRAKNWRIVGIILIALLMIYLAGLFATFLFNSRV